MMMKVALPKWLLDLASPNQWIEDEKQIALLMLKLMLFAVASLWWRRIGSCITVNNITLCYFVLIRQLASTSKAGYLMSNFSNIWWKLPCGVNQAIFTQEHKRRPSNWGTDSLRSWQYQMQLLDWRIPGTMAMFSLERNAPEDRKVFNIFFNLWEDNPLDSKGESSRKLDQSHTSLLYVHT